jgi:ABC-type xylose transport system permease subunit
MKVKLDFAGGALALFGYLILAGILGMFIIPAAWGAVILYAWMARNIRLSDGSSVAFTGRGSEIWWAFVLAMLAMQLPQIPILFQEGPQAQPSTGFILSLILLLVIGMLISFYFFFLILRWIIRSIEFSLGGRLAFQGNFWGYLGWVVLFYISAILIIAPAWVASAFIRWLLAKTTSSTNETLTWTGTGWGILWRTLVMYLLCIFIIPIPWAIRWFIRWLIQNVEIEKKESAV